MCYAVYERLKTLLTAAHLDDVSFAGGFCRHDGREWSPKQGGSSAGSFQQDHARTQRHRVNRSDVSTGVSRVCVCTWMLLGWLVV